MKRGSLDPALIAAISPGRQQQVARPSQLTSDPLSAQHSNIQHPLLSEIHRAATESGRGLRDASGERPPQRRIAPIQQQHVDSGRQLTSSDRRAAANTTHERKRSGSSNVPPMPASGTGATKQFRLAPSSSVLQELAEQLVPRHRPPQPSAAARRRRLRSSFSEEVCAYFYFTALYIYSIVN